MPNTRKATMTMRHRIASVALAAAALAAPQAAMALGGDGPRAYFIVPADTNILSAYYYWVDSDLSVDGTFTIDGTLRNNIFALQYTRTFDVGGRNVGLFGLVPYVAVNGNLDVPGRPVSFESQAFGDFLIGGVIGLAGNPALTPAAYVSATPGLEVGLFAKLTLPTGDYDADSAVNIGANRYSFQLGVPVVWYLGKSYLDPALTTIEITPAVLFFTDNEDPGNGASSTGQAPLYTLEAHLTRNFGSANWLSLDALYTWGGETSADGVEDDNPREALGLGASWNVAFNPQTSLKVSYGTNVYANENGGEGQLVRLILTRTF